MRALLRSMSAVSKSERVNISSQCTETLLRLNGMTSSACRVVDQAEPALRRDQLDDLGEMARRCWWSRTRSPVRRSQSLRPAPPSGLPMIDDVMRAELRAPNRCVSGRDAVAITVRSVSCARELDRDRADAAGAADDQDGSCAAPGTGCLTSSRSNSDFPGGDRRQRQRRPPAAQSERLRLAADDALVDQVELGIGARPADGAGIEHLVARLEAVSPPGPTAATMPAASQPSTFQRPASGLARAAHLGVDRD